MRLLLPCFVQLPYGTWPVSFCNVPLATAVKNNSMRECFGVSLRVTEFISPMSRRQVVNRRELLLPLQIPDRYPTGIVFEPEPCVPAGPTEIARGETGEPPEAWTRHTTHCNPAKQTTETIEGATAALIAGNHLLAQLVFLRIRPGRHRGTTNEQTGSPHKVQRTRPLIAPPDVAAPHVKCAEVPVPAPIPPEVETLFTQLARRRLRRRTLEETR
jgi:hypothetical protein